MAQTFIIIIILFWSTSSFDHDYFIILLLWVKRTTAAGFADATHKIACLLEYYSRHPRRRATRQQENHSELNMVSYVEKKQAEAQRGNRSRNAEQRSRLTKSTT